MVSPVEAHPDTATLLGWIEEIVSWGVRRPCTPADETAIDWIAAKFGAFGLQDVRLEPLDVLLWSCESADLELRRSDDPSATRFIEGFALPYCSPTRGVTASVAELEQQPIEGSIAWAQIDLITLPGPVMRALASEAVDPDDSFDVLTQTYPFSSRAIELLGPFAEQGAVGFIGILNEGFWETNQYYVPYDAVPRQIPGIWISPADGMKFLDMVRSGPVTAKLTVDAGLTTGESANVVGVLPGASDDWIVIGTHHDAPWASAVEDASGIAMLLAQAAAWAAVPQDERPHNLLFVATAAHMAGGAGTAAFITDHRDQLQSVVCEIHLEHIAKASKVEQGRLIPLDPPEVRWWFTSPNQALQQLVVNSLKAEKIDRSLLMHPEIFGTHPTTDGGPFHLEGVPLVNLLAAPRYLFDPGDTIEMVHSDSLVPLTRAVTRIIHGLGAHTPDSMRAGIDPAPPPQLPVKFGR